MKLVVAFRALCVIVAIACAVASLVGGAPMHARLRRIARLSAAGALATQLAVTGTEVAARRAPWTRVLLPLVGIALAVRAFATASPSPWSLVPFALLDLAVAVIAAVTIVRVLRRTPNAYAEDVLERELLRFASAAFARYVAVEIVTIFAAVRFCCGGFRGPLAPGFSYVRRWGDAPLLLAAPVIFVLPEMLAFDVALARAPWYWRAGSDVLHAYAALWLIGIFATARARPHRCDGERVRLRFAALRRLDVPRDAIASVAVCARVVSARALRAPQTLVMALSGSPALDLHLREPISVRSPFGRARTIDRVIVAVDDPDAFACALSA